MALAAMGLEAPLGQIAALPLLRVAQEETAGPVLRMQEPEGVGRGQM